MSPDGSAMTAMVEAGRRHNPANVKRWLSRHQFATLCVVTATVFAGVATALQKWLRYDYPGVVGDPMMQTATITLVYAVLGVAFKILIVKFHIGSWIERRLDTNRPVRFGDVLSPRIRMTAILGGVLQVVHSMLFVALVVVVSPAGLAAARACVVAPIAILELFVGILVPKGRGWWARLLCSVGLTLAGGLIVVLSGNTALLQKSGAIYILILLLLVTVGNGCLAIAEWQEWKGVNTPDVAAPVYTLARFITYLITCVVVVVGWGIINGGFHIMWAVIQMCAARWYLVLSMAFFWALTDLVRICVKSIIPATYMYTIMALSVMIDVFAQLGLYYWKPAIYNNVDASLTHIFAAVVGAGLVLGASFLYPHPQSRREVPAPAPTL